ncbi:hypothetical protein WAI453_003776 [Rhynchosporium graminicola]
MHQQSIKGGGTSKRAASSSLETPPPKRKLPWVILTSTENNSSFSTPQRMVEVTVEDRSANDKSGGTKVQVFTIHHTVLTCYSSSFRKIVAADSDCNTMVINGCGTAFGLLQHWMYTSQIQGPAGILKLMEYVKMWKITDHIGIVGIVDDLLHLIKETMPGPNNDTGNTLKDFQTIAYMGSYSGFKEIAIAKTLAIMRGANTPRIFVDMPAAMRASFTLAMMQECVSLPGWDNGDGFAGVRQRVHEIGAQKNSPRADSVINHAGSSAYETTCSSDNENEDKSDEEAVPETGLLSHDEVPINTPPSAQRVPQAGQSSGKNWAVPGR